MSQHSSQRHQPVFLLCSHQLHSPSFYSPQATVLNQEMFKISLYIFSKCNFCFFGMWPLFIWSFFPIQSCKNLYPRKKRGGPHDTQTHPGPFWTLKSIQQVEFLDTTWEQFNLQLPVVVGAQPVAAVHVHTTRVGACIRHSMIQTPLSTFKSHQLLRGTFLGRQNHRLFCFYFFFVCFIFMFALYLFFQMSVKWNATDIL